MTDDGTLLALLGVGLLAGASLFGKRAASASAATALPPLDEGSAMIALPGSNPDELSFLGVYHPKTELLETVSGLSANRQAEIAALFQPRQQRQIGYDSPQSWEW